MTLAANDPRHGTQTGYNRHDCRCEPCRDAYAPIGRRHMKWKQDVTLGVASNKSSRWTSAEIEFITTSDLPLVEMASRLGRTYWSVAVMRTRIKKSIEANEAKP